MPIDTTPTAPPAPPAPPATRGAMIQILTGAPIAADSPLASYREGLAISAQGWRRCRRIAYDETRRSTYGAIATVCGGNARLVSAVVRALFDVDGFNQLGDAEVLALWHWVRPFRAGDHWATEVQAVYETVAAVKALVVQAR